MTADPGPHPSYLHGHHESVLRSHRWRTAENSAAYLLAELEPGARILDVGCGPGTITVDLARLVPDGHVLGIDAAEAVLDDARTEARQGGVGNVDFEVGDVSRLDCAAGSYDVVHAHQVLQHLTDPVAALSEMRRVCRPGGVVAARDGDYGGMFWYPHDPDLQEWRALYQRVAKAVGGEPDAGRRMAHWARRAGFAQIRASASSWCFATPDERAWWGGLWAERLTRSRFAHQALSHDCASSDDLARLANAWRRWSSDPDGWFVVPHGEVLCRG
jgi:ubiquinone/menaquinone biosynthesis C-methylase UbiE